MEENKAKKLMTMMERKFNRYVEIINIIDNNNLSEQQKTNKIYELIRQPEKFEKSYRAVYKYKDASGKYDEYKVGGLLNRFPSICGKLYEYKEKGLFKKAQKEHLLVQYWINNKSLFERYNYGEFILNEYIGSMESNNEENFYEKYNINENILNDMANVVSIFNDDLYMLYLKKQKENNNKNVIQNYTKLKNIAFGIKHGKALDGEDFDELKFWQLAPFMYVPKLGNKSLLDGHYANDLDRNRKFFYTVKNFMETTMPEDQFTVINYMNEKKLFSFTKINERLLKEHFAQFKYNVIFNINGKKETRILTMDDLDNMLKYLKINKIALTNETLRLVFKKYTTGKVNINELNNIQLDTNAIKIPKK